LWLRLDLSKASGGLARPATDALLCAASARTGGQMHSLDVSACKSITHACLLAVLAANAGALRELHAWLGYGDFGCDLFPGFVHIEALVRAAPQLSVFDAAKGVRKRGGGAAHAAQRGCLRAAAAAHAWRHLQRAN
jgi:hypothetical protein